MYFTIMLLVVFAAGFYLGWRINDTITKMTFAKMLKESGVTNKELEKFLNYWRPQMEPNEPEAEAMIIEIKIEKHGNQLYAYRADNDEFLGQGESKEDLIQHMSSKFSNNVKMQIIEGKEHFSG